MECRIGDPLDNLIYFDGDFEPELRLFLPTLAPQLSTIVDVGCNIGYVSCLLASLTRGRARIISIDANPEMVARCESNLRLNNFRAEMCGSAVGQREELRALNIPRHRPSYSSFGKLDYDCDALDVPVRRLDALAREKGLTEIDLLKIDVEGFEPEVLSGLGALPVRNICFEVSRDNLRQCGYRLRDLWSLPLWKNYRLFQIERMTGRPLPFDASAARTRSLEIVWAQALTWFDSKLPISDE
jgi:FkbM family methyltransferase